MIHTRVDDLDLVSMSQVFQKQTANSVVFIFLILVLSGRNVIRLLRMLKRLCSEFCARPWCLFLREIMISGF